MFIFLPESHDFHMHNRHAVLYKIQLETFIVNKL